MDSHELIEGLKQGSREAGKWLLDTFQRPLIRYFQASLPDPQAAPDAAQEVFLRLIHSLRTKPGLEIGSLQAFLFTIARRLVIDQVRQKYRQPSFESLDQSEESGRPGPPRTLLNRIADTQPDPREMSERLERSRYVTEAIRSLDPELREVTVLHHVEGLTGREIAKLLKLEEGTVWSRLHRSLRILRRTLAPCGIKPPTPNPKSPRDARKQP